MLRKAASSAVGACVGICRAAACPAATRHAPQAAGGAWRLSPPGHITSLIAKMSSSPLLRDGMAGPSSPLHHQQHSRQVSAAAAPPSGDGSSAGIGLPPPATMQYRLPLFLGYSTLGAGLTFGLGSHLEPNVALALTSTLWLGFVLGISLTEAWVKFKAPLLERHVAVDVGRHVFPALNSVEAALALTTAMQIYYYGGEATPFAALPAAAGLMVAAQIAWLTPALSLRAQHLIASSADPGALNPRQLAALEGIKRTVAASPAPAPWLHKVYGVLELSKVALLGTYIWQLVAT